VKITLISAIIGGIDDPKIYPAQSVEYDFRTFTEPGPDCPVGVNDRIKALYYKTQMYRISPESEVLIWVDGKILPTCYDFVEQVVNALGENDIAILKHRDRSCIYEEINYIEKEIRMGSRYLRTRYGKRPIRKEVEYYRACGYPEKNGLNDCCIVAMKNNEQMKSVTNGWWSACHGGAFDQIAIQFVCWREEVKIIPIVFKPGSFVHVKHKLLK